MIEAGFWSLTGNTVRAMPERIAGSIGQSGIAWLVVNYSIS
jgi:hypothetical protein